MLCGLNTHQRLASKIINQAREPRKTSAKEYQNQAVWPAWLCGSVGKGACSHAWQWVTQRATSSSKVVFQPFPGCTHNKQKCVQGKRKCKKRQRKGKARTKNQKVSKPSVGAQAWDPTREGGRKKTITLSILWQKEKGNSQFFLFLFCFETGSHITQVGSDLAMQLELALNS